MAKKILYRQGDVLLTKIEELPEDLEVSKRPMAGKNLITLAYGEATGHHHSIKNDGNVSLLETKEESNASQVFLKIMGTEAALTHQEHAPITLPAGDYRVTIQKEYTPEAIQNVVD